MAPVQIVPTDVPSVPGTVLSYMEIKVGTSVSNLGESTLTFNIKKSDFRLKNLDPSTVRMMRYADGAWQTLTTTMEFEDLSTYTFEATTPGFSYFAIVGDEFEAAVTPVVTPKKTEEETVILQSTEEKSGVNPLIFLAVIVVIAAVAYLYLSGQKPWKTK